MSSPKSEPSPIQTKIPKTQITTTPSQTNTPGTSSGEAEGEAGKLTANLTQDQIDARIKVASSTKNPLQFKDPSDRQAATFAKAQRIVTNPKFQALPDERKAAILGNYYDKIVSPAYTRAGYQAPDKELWIRAMPQAGANNVTNVGSFYLGNNARSVAETGAAAISAAGNVTTGITYAGIALTHAAGKAFLGLSRYFGDPHVDDESKSIADAQAMNDRIAARSKQAVANISHNVFDQSNFWLQTHPSKSWIDSVDTFAGEQLIQLPLYEAIGAGRVLSMGKLSELVPASLTKGLELTKAGKFVARRMGEAADAFLGATFQNSKPGEKITDMLSFMTLGAASEGVTKAIMLPTRMAVKKLTATNLAMGGLPLQKAITDEAEKELAHHIHMTTDELNQYQQHDSVKASSVTAEKVTLTAMGKQKYGKIWSQLSQAQRRTIRASRDDMTHEAIGELPLHLPDLAQAHAEHTLQEDVKQNPRLAQRVQEFQQKFGLKVADITVSTEKQALEAQTGVKNSQATITKLGANRAPKLDPALAIARHEEPLKYAALKESTLAYFKNAKKWLGDESGFAEIPFGKKTAPETNRTLAARLKDMESDEFVEDLKAQMGAGKYKFENPEHALLWANHFRKELPEPFQKRLIAELHERNPMGTVKEWDTASDNLERHMDYLATTGRLYTQKNIFNSTRVNDWTDKTKYQYELLDEVDDTEFEKVKGALKKYPAEYKQAKLTLEKLQLARRASATGTEDRNLTIAIRKLDKRQKGKQVKNREKS